MSLDEQKIGDEIYNAAFAAVVKASKHVLQYWPNPLNPHFDKHKVMDIFEKHTGIGNYATIADTESEDIIIKMIQESPLLQGHHILAEESGENTSRSPYVWIIDPIDGTQNFRNGMSDFGISIGVIYNNEPIVGLIAMPALGQIISAKKDHGATLLTMEGEKLLDLRKIEYAEPLDKALIAYDLGYENRAEQMKNKVEKIVDKIGYAPVYGSTTAANYRLALGYIGGYFHMTPTPYDIAAAAIIIKEAGGIVTDIKGNNIDWHAQHVTYLAAKNKTLHQQILELLH